MTDKWSDEKVRTVLRGARGKIKEVRQDISDALPHVPCPGEHEKLLGEADRACENMEQVIHDIDVVRGK